MELKLHNGIIGGNRPAKSLLVEALQQNRSDELKAELQRSNISSQERRGLEEKLAMQLQMEAAVRGEMLNAFGWKGCEVIDVGIADADDTPTTDTSWGNPEMDKLEADLRAVLAASSVPAEDQSSILHHLASEADAEASGESQAT